jgi:hypothetical protein
MCVCEMKRYEEVEEEGEEEDGKDRMALRRKN